MFCNCLFFCCFCFCFFAGRGYIFKCFQHPQISSLILIFRLWKHLSFEYIVHCTCTFLCCAKKEKKNARKTFTGLWLHDFLSIVSYLLIVEAVISFAICFSNWRWFLETKSRQFVLMKDWCLITHYLINETFTICISEFYLW